MNLNKVSCEQLQRNQHIKTRMSGSESKNNQPNGEMVLLAPLVRPYAWPGLRWVFEFAKRTVHSRPRDVSTNIDNHEFVSLLARDPLQAQVLPVAWVNAMVNWFKHFESSHPSILNPVIIHGYGDRTVSYRHNLPLLKQIYPQSQICLLYTSDAADE